jgi:hypothetical protein
MILELMVNLFSSGNFGLDLKPSFTIAKGDSTFYHQHVLRMQGYYKKSARRAGLSLDYNLYNNDPLKRPDGLWLLAIYLEF